MSAQLQAGHEPRSSGRRGRLRPLQGHQPLGRPRPDSRENVAAEIIERGLLEPAPRRRRHVRLTDDISWGERAPAPVGDLRFAVATALEDVRHGISPRHGLQLHRPGHGVLVVDAHDVARGRRNLGAVATDSWPALTKRLSGQGTSGRVIVGVSVPATTLTHAQRCYRQATTAAHHGDRRDRYPRWTSSRSATP